MRYINHTNRMRYFVDFYASCINMKSNLLLPRQNRAFPTSQKVIKARKPYKSLDLECFFVGRINYSRPEFGTMLMFEPRLWTREKLRNLSIFLCWSLFGMPLDFCFITKDRITFMNWKLHMWYVRNRILQIIIWSWKVAMNFDYTHFNYIYLNLHISFKMLSTKKVKIFVCFFS